MLMVVILDLNLSITWARFYIQWVLVDKADLCSDTDFFAGGSLFVNLKQQQFTTQFYFLS